jgi:hypothetical protein
MLWDELPMALSDQIRKGGLISYDDGRRGHSGVRATVLEVDSRGMTVQFDDRADTNYVLFADPSWISFVSVVQ